MALFGTFWSGLFGGLSAVGRRDRGTQRASARESDSDANIIVTAETAFNLSAVFSAVRLIAESLGSLPMQCHKVDFKGNRTLAPEHWLAQVLCVSPNRYQTPNEFWETVGMEEAMHGNAYCLISWSGEPRNSRITSLLPLMADQMDVRLDENGDLTYRYYQNGTITVLAPESVWHLKSMGNGVVGLSPLHYARQAIGLGLAADQRASKFARRGFKPAGVLMTDKLLKPEQREAIRREFADLVEGDGDALKVLEAGFSYQQVSLSPADSQLLESRKFQLQDIARFFGVPAIMIGEQSASTVWGTGIEALVEGWYRFGLRPRIERIEASIRKNLLPPGDRSTFVFEFSLDNLLRMNPTARATRIKEHVQSGLLTPNEGRLEMGYPKSTDPNAEFLYMQQQMVRLGTAPRGPVATQANT